MKKTILYLLAFILVFSVYGFSAKKWEFDFESGFAWNGYNDVQIPKDTGTRFSLTDNFDVESKVFLRMRLSYNFNRKHQLSLLYAPLSLTAKGTTEKPIIFEGTVFPQNTEINGLYRFDSYRLTYSYLLLSKNNLNIRIGFTAKIRDAEVELKSSKLISEKTNTGFVPLLNFQLNWNLNDKLDFKLSADALASKQGRAEDVFAGILYSMNKNIKIKLGYRIVEGGANVEEVYNFALIHYFSSGLIISF